MTNTTRTAAAASSRNGIRYSKADREEFARRDQVRSSTKIVALSPEEALVAITDYIHPEADGSFGFYRGEELVYLRGAEAAAEWQAWHARRLARLGA